jgi:ribose 5-phosphate isomerase A
VVSFGLKATERAIAGAIRASSHEGKLTLRRGSDGHVFVTDGGHFILDASLGEITDPKSLAAELSLIPGVVEHGLFLGLAHAAILAGPNGIHIVERS